MFYSFDQLGPYTLISKLGRGAFGEVWLAEKRTAVTTTKLAVKIPLSTDFDFNSLKQEADLWVQAAGHPNVLPIIDADVYDDIIVIASEYAPSGSLAEWMKKNGGLAPSVGSALEMVDGILAGLQHLHSRKIIHRDIKPANILLQGQTPRLTDFGIARLLRTDNQSLVVAGTLPYMSPETLNGDRSELADLWAASVVLYELLTGQLPFPQTEMGALIRAICSDSHRPLPSNFQRNIHAIIDRAFDKSPRLRYKSATEMREALHGILNEANSLGISDIRPLQDDDLGNGIRIGGVYRGKPLSIVAGNWINYYDTGWVRSGWFYTPERTYNFAETFFKIHIFHEGNGYMHILASANPEHIIWLETGTGFRKEEPLCWSGETSTPRTDLWFFNWK